MSDFVTEFKKVQAEAYETAKRLGFEDDTKNPLYVPAKLALVGTEISEAIESHRKGDDSHIAVDLADIVLRTMDLASGLGIDLAQAILDKSALNKKRTFRNGNLRYYPTGSEENKMTPQKARLLTIAEIEMFDKKMNDGYRLLSGEIAELLATARAAMKATEALRVSHEALLWATEMFVARDEMNAKVHCSPVRLSPITEKCRLARNVSEDALKPFQQVKTCGCGMPRCEVDNLKMGEDKK